MLWKISQQPDPGTMDDFYEGLKVKKDRTTRTAILAHQRRIGTGRPIYCFFQVFDNDGQGKVHISALTRALTGLADKMTDKQVDQLAEGLMDQNGDIKIVDFIAKCTSD